VFASLRGGWEVPILLCLLPVAAEENVSIPQLLLHGAMVTTLGCRVAGLVGWIVVMPC
jgi:hypothetical protein